MPDLIQLGDQALRSSAPSWADYFGRHEFRIKGGYRMLSHPEYNAFAQEISGWDTPSVAAIQHASFRHFLDEFKAGRQRGDMRALTQIFHKIAGPNSTVLEEGCGSGYNSELIRLAAGPDVQYTGIDIAHSMVNLARQTYPGDAFEVMQSEDLRYEDGQFDIVLNGASLMHTIDYDKALDEARRVASRYVVLHTPGPAWDRSKSPFEQVGVQAHINHYRKLQQDGKLDLGGPFMDATEGGMMIPAAGIAEDEIRKFAEDDPAVRSGLLRAEVRPWLIGMRR